MNEKRDIVIIGSHLTLALIIVFGLVTITMRAQEKREPRTWRVMMLQEVGDNLSLTAYRAVRIDVVDTDGVCLYVARQFRSGAGDSPSIVAVPKTQLASGKGCQ